MFSTFLWKRKVRMDSKFYGFELRKILEEKLVGSVSLNIYSDIS